MEKEFDFNSIGKKMPYSVSEGFFNTFKENVIIEANKRSKRGARLRKIRLRITTIAASIVVIIGVGLWYNSSEKLSNIMVEDVITQLSDSDLQQIISNETYDLYHNE